MTTWPPSSSKESTGARASAEFLRLHEQIQRWVWEQRWTELRDIQEKAVGPILEGGRDVVLAAATAGGKTEA
ncbi:MAG: hypothetical protein L0387_21530, partial [Acidobacteria bacterium]|nr:hypothetical protein [Acidobacteriota bacterium]